MHDVDDDEACTSQFTSQCITNEAYNIIPEAIRLSYEMTCFNYVNHTNHTALLMLCSPVWCFSLDRVSHIICRTTCTHIHMHSYTHAYTWYRIPSHHQHHHSLSHTTSYFHTHIAIISHSFYFHFTFESFLHAWMILPRASQAHKSSHYVINKGLELVIK